jgi:hypothetical protein
VRPAGQASCAPGWLSLRPSVACPARTGLWAVSRGRSTELVSIGTKILSARIVTDIARLYAQAFDFWKGATDSQKKTLRGFSLPLLALAVHQGLVLEQMFEASQVAGQSDDETRATSEKGALDAFQRSIVLRDQAYTALRGAAGRKDALVTSLDAVVGDAKTGASLARGLDSLARLLRGWLATGGPLAQRLALASLDEAFAVELEHAAEAVRGSEAKARRRSAVAKVTQAQLDRQDGINMVLLGQVIRAFEHAHDRDPTIPRLVPIATRRLFSHRAGGSAVIEASPSPTTGDGSASVAPAGNAG